MTAFRYGRLRVLSLVMSAVVAKVLRISLVRRERTEGL